MTIPVTDVKLGNRLRQIRTALGMSQEEVARQARVSAATVVKIENRADYVPTKPVRQRLAQAVHSTEGWVFFYELVGDPASEGVA